MDVGAVVDTINQGLALPRGGKRRAGVVSFPRAERQRRSARQPQATTVQYSASFFVHQHSFSSLPDDPIVVRPFDLRYKTTSNKSKTFPPSQSHPFHDPSPRLLSPLSTFGVRRLGLRVWIINRTIGEVHHWFLIRSQCVFLFPLSARVSRLVSFSLTQHSRSHRTAVHDASVDPAHSPILSHPFPLSWTTFSSHRR